MTKRSHLLFFVGTEVLKFPPPQSRKSRHSPGLPAPDPSWPRCPAPREEPWPSKLCLGTSGHVHVHSTRSLFCCKTGKIKNLSHRPILWDFSERWNSKWKRNPWVHMAGNKWDVLGSSCFHLSEFLYILKNLWWIFGEILWWNALVKLAVALQFNTVYKWCLHFNSIF